MERGYSDPNSASEMLARAYDDEPEKDYVAVQPVGDTRLSESSELEERLDLLQASCGGDFDTD